MKNRARASTVWALRLLDMCSPGAWWNLKDFRVTQMPRDSRIGARIFTRLLPRGPRHPNPCPPDSFQEVVWLEWLVWHFWPQELTSATETPEKSQYGGGRVGLRFGQ